MPGGVPPIMVKSAFPSFPPTQLISVPAMLAINVSGSVIVTHAVVVHKLTSVTVTQ
ncbi:hypothetical protein ES703_90736 [subsurface metagenome]